MYKIVIDFLNAKGCYTPGVTIAATVHLLYLYIFLVFLQYLIVF
jgi:hypothetical protein